MAPSLPPSTQVSVLSCGRTGSVYRVGSLSRTVLPPGGGGGGAGSGGGKLSDLDLDGQTQSGGVATHTGVGPSCPPSLPLA